MPELNGIQDVMDSMRKQSGASVPSGKKVTEPVNLAKALYEGVENETNRNIMLGMINKTIGSQDLNAFRVVSLYDQMGVLANNQTLFLNMLEQKPVVRVRDFQVQFIEDRQGSDTADWVNMLSESFPSPTQGNYPVRTNTLGFFGTSVKAFMIAQELGQQSQVMPGFDAVAREVTKAVRRLRWHLEGNLLSNSEVTIENGNVATEFGGFLTRSTLYNTSTAGDLTNALIQSRIDAIANDQSLEGLNYDVPLFAFCPSDQLAKVRDLMISRYPGENSATNMVLQNELLRGMADKNLAPNQVVGYQPLPGTPVGFMYNPRMPSGTVLFFDPTQPKLGKMQMMGQFGPWLIDKTPSQTALVQLEYVLDCATLIDPLRE